MVQHKIEKSGDENEVACIGIVIVGDGMHCR